MATWEERHRVRSIIKFSFDDAELKTGAKLSRAPTPYPKELRALAKHARNIAASKTSSSSTSASPSGAGPEGNNEERDEAAGGTSRMSRDEHVAFIQVRRV